MAEKINIAKLDINTEQIVEKSAKLRKELDELKETRKQLKKQDGDNSKELSKLDAGIKSLSASYRNNQKVLNSLYNENNKFLKTEEKLKLTLDQEITSINTARQANKDLLAIRNDLNLETEEGRKNRDIINQQIDKNNDFIKENVSELEKQKIGIGGYSDAIKDAIDETGIFNGAISSVKNVYQTFAPILVQVKNDFHNVTDEFRKGTQATEGMTTAQKTLNKVNKGTIAGLKLLKLALIGTGIGAIVVAFGALVTYLSTTQKGIDQVNRVLTPLKEIFGSLVGLVQDFGKDIFDAFSNPKKLIKDIGDLIKQNLINRFTALSKIAKSFFEGDWAGVADGVTQAATGVENLGQKIKNAAENTQDFLGTAIDRGKEIQRLQEEIERGQNQLILNESRYNKEIKAANKIAEDQTKTLAEREEAARRSVELSEQLLQEQQAILDKEIEQTRLKQEANDTSREDEKELNELLAKRNDLETAALELQTTQTNKLNTIRNQAASEAEKQTAKRIELANKEFEEKIQLQEQELELFILQQEQKNQTQKQELETAKEIKDQRLLIEKEKYEAGKLSETEYQIALLEIKEQYNDKSVEVALQLAEREKEAAIKKIEDEVAYEIEKNDRLAEVRRQYEAERLAQGAIDQEEYNRLINEINEENRLKNKELEEERREFEREIDLEREQETFLSKFERQKERLEQERQLAVQEAERLGADVNAVNQLYADKEEEIDKAKNQAIIESRLTTAKAIAGILGEQSMAAKVVALAEAGYNLGVAISQANTVPFPANILAIAQATAAGVKAINSITAVQEAKPKIGKAAKGATLRGRSHAQGGETLFDSNGNPIVEAEADENIYVLNKRASGMINSLSNLNQMTGGIPLTEKTTFAAAGGMVQRSFSNSANNAINYDVLAEKMAQAYSAIPAPQVAVTEINNGQSNYAKIVEDANF